MTITITPFLWFDENAGEAVDRYLEVFADAELVDAQTGISEALIAGGGDQGPCGWLKDPYGLSWQVVPTVLMQLMGDPDSEKSGQVRDAMMLMTRLDTVGLQRANGGG